MILDISNFYLMTPLKRKEYMGKKKQGKKPGWWTFFHVQGCLFPPQQWSGAQHSTDHEKNHVPGVVRAAS